MGAAWAIVGNTTFRNGSGYRNRAIATCSMFVLPCVYQVDASVKRMAGFAKEQVDTWKASLRGKGFSASERRLNCVCHFLLRNDFYSIEDLNGAPYPAVWEGANALLQGMTMVDPCLKSALLVL